MSGSGTGVSDASDETSEWKPGTLPPVVLQRGLIITTLRTLPKFLTSSLAHIWVWYIDVG